MSILILKSGNSSPARGGTRTRKKTAHWPSILFTATILVILGAGFAERNEYWYSADRGVGYAFGVIGFSMMALLLLYPARKHWHVMSRWFAIRHWFRLHMVLGVLGPTMIMLHTNFRFGSVNSMVALFSMLLVATSGLVGRYVYAQVHKGLYGEAVHYKDLVLELQAAEGLQKVRQDADIVSMRRLLDADRASLMRLIAFGRNLDRRARASMSDLEHDAMRTLRRMVRLRLFSRLFSLWHVFHMPFFLMMCVTAAVHIVVVHMY